ncbi:MAG: KpsF/GutQ family sugar-phosphate isomerase [Verrucomicrobiota bacterium]
MDYLAKAQRVIEIEITELQRLLRSIDDHFSEAVATLQKTLENEHKIVVVGIGKSYNIAHKVAATLNSTGATTVVLNSQNALHGDLGLVSNGDTVIALSYSGETDELLNLLPHLKRSAGKLIAFTGNPQSTLGKNSDLVLNVRVEREACPLNLAPTSSTTNMLVLGDALAMVLLEARGFRDEDFAQFHPGGKLGRTLLTRVRDIMRHGDQLVIASPETTIETALNDMQHARAGAAVVTDPRGKLLGVFTHGDFVRAYQKDRDVASHSLKDHMTTGPVAISGDKIAAEVLATLNRHRVDDIIVIDEDETVIGLVDTQDLSRLNLL